MNPLNAVLNFGSDVWSAYQKTPLTNHVLKRVGVAAAVLPAMSLGLAYFRGDKEVDLNLSSAASAAAGWLGIELVRGSYQFIQGFIDNIRNAKNERELAAHQKRLLGQVRNKISNIQAELVVASNKPDSELNALLIHFKALENDLVRLSARTSAELSNDATQLYFLVRAHDLVFQNWELLVSQNASGVGHPFRDGLTGSLPGLPSQINQSTIDTLSQLQQQLACNLPAQIKKDLDELEQEIVRAGLNPIDYPLQEYRHLKTQFSNLKNHAQAIRTKAELDGDLKRFGELKEAKQLVFKIWGQLRAQNIAVNGGSLRSELTRLLTHAGPINLVDLERLSEQLDVRQQAVQQIHVLSNIQNWHGLLEQLQNVKAEQERLSPKIASLRSEIDEVSDYIQAFEVQASAASDAGSLFSKSPKQILNEKIASLKSQKKDLEVKIDQLRMDFLKCPYLININHTLQHLRIQKGTNEFNQFISDLDHIKSLLTSSHLSTQATIREQIQNHPNLSISNLNDLIRMTQRKIDNLIKFRNLPHLINGFAEVRDALDSFVDQPNLTAQKNAFNDALSLFRNSTTVPSNGASAPRPAPAAPLPAPVPLRWYEKRFVQIGAAAGGAILTAGAALWAAPAFTATAMMVIAGGAGLDHVKGKQRIQKIWDKYFGKGSQPVLARTLLSSPAVPPQVAPRSAAAAPILGADPYAGLGRIGSAQYQLKAKALVSKPSNFNFSNQMIAFPREEEYGNTAASLQLLANARPLMNVLQNPLFFTEQDLFGKEGVAGIGSRNRDLDATKQQVLLKLANSLQADKVLDEEEILTDLRNLTHDGKIGAIHGLETKTHKWNIARLLVSLELKALYRKAGEGRIVSREDLKYLVRSAEILRKCLEVKSNGDFNDPLLLKPSDLTVDPEMLTFLLTRAIDYNGSICGIYRSDELRLRPEHDVVFVRNEDFKAKASKVEIHDAKYQILGTLEQQDSGAYQACISKKSGFMGSTWNVYRNNEITKTRQTPQPAPLSPWKSKITMLVKA